MTTVPDIRLIALDLDGTLTNAAKVITPATYDALMTAQQKGVRLILSSGRPPYGMRPLARQLHMHRYGGMLLCYNGGHIEDCATHQVLVQTMLSDSLLTFLRSCQQRSGLTLMTYHDDTIYTERPDNQYVAISAFSNKMHVKGVPNIITDTPRPLYKFLLVGEPHTILEWEPIMQREAEGRMHIVRSTPYFIECLPLGIDKGTALAQLLQQQHLDRRHLMAFGDGNNDIGMLQTAGIGVAMSNAEEHVRQMADYVTLSNEDDGVAAALRHFGIV